MFANKALTVLLFYSVTDEGIPFVNENTFQVKQ